ncbi:hypothetical protein QA599_19905, partial [Haloarculaceae archaeon H-GB1-1]|nr:hypothetical protein [Haloarculaceae archaeon H-GB1-1]
PAYHIEDEEPQNDVEDILKNLRDPEVHTERAAHNYEALQESIEYYTEVRDREYSDQELEEGHGFWIERFDKYIWGDGTVVPSSVDDWKALHEGFESGADFIRELNETYHNSEYGENGEIAAFSVAENGSVSMEDLPEDYNVSEDGIPGNPAA